jgi:hypothetical protein
MMGRDSGVVSKVLVLDASAVHLDSLKAFCEEHDLVGIRPQQGGVANVMAILQSNIDLGGILLYENFGGPAAGLLLAREIHQARPELPLFLRRDVCASMAGLSPRDAAMFRCAYTLNDLQLLRATLENSIFSRVYPNELVRAISEMTRTSLATLFHDCVIDVETPYLVKDRIIYGEVFTLIAIESHWCRGYMMFQGEEQALIGICTQPRAETGEKIGFRELNSTLGEATNLVWGAFKNRYVAAQTPSDHGFQTQVPIIINHQRRYISFGSDDPQLCIKYTLQPRDQPQAPAVPLYQRFVFNLNWSPDELTENPVVESLFSAGELELF